jgi:long-chain fatty acid transport protein
MMLGLGKPSRPLLAMSAGILTCAIALSPASATEGYFQNGYGARQKALAGAGAADSRDATAAALNPAGLVHVGTEASIAASLFSPRREVESPAFFGTVESGSDYFIVPNLAASYRFAPNPFVDVVGFTVYGNGGMNTDWPAAANAFPAPAGPGVFGGGKAGVDLQQALISLAFAKQFGPVAVGIAPILARQQFKARGLGAFNITQNDTDVSWGGGVRGGIEVSLSPALRLGVAASSRIWTQDFDKYSGLFAERGGFDIPPSLQAGIAFDLTPSLTLLADYKHIWFGSVKSIANPSTNPPPFGADNGPGFGWDDVDVLKLGVEWRTSPDLTLRAGYAYATNAISARDVQLNILAPAVVQHHITAGFEYQLDRNLSVEFAGLYAPEGEQSGYFLDGVTPLDLRMHQYEATLGFKYKWDEPRAALK